MKTIGRSIFIIFSFICAGFLPQLQAVSPPPDGGYVGENTAEGTSALFSLTNGISIGTRNTANGFNALGANQIGNDNTADGFDALGSNSTGSQNTATGSYA